MARLADDYLDLDQQPASGWDPEAWNREHAELERLIEVSNNLPDGEVVGTVLMYPRGDGAAVYIVTKASPLTVQWVKTGDAWQVEAALIRGLRKADIIEDQRRHRAIRAMFASTP